MLGLEKSIVERLFEETIKTLEWRRLILWREIDRIQSGLPGEAERARSRVRRLQGELEKDFEQAHKILDERENLEEQSHRNYRPSLSHCRRIISSGVLKNKDWG